MQSCVLYMKFGTLYACLCWYWCQHDEKSHIWSWYTWNFIKWVICLHSCVGIDKLCDEWACFWCNMMHEYDGISMMEWSLMILVWSRYIDTPMVLYCVVTHAYTMMVCHARMSVNKICDWYAACWEGLLWLALVEEENSSTCLGCRFVEYPNNASSLCGIFYVVSLEAGGPHTRPRTT